MFTYRVYYRFFCENPPSNVHIHIIKTREVARDHCIVYSIGLKSYLTLFCSFIYLFQSNARYFVNH